LHKVFVFPAGSEDQTSHTGQMFTLGNGSKMNKHIMNLKTRKCH